MKNKQELIAKLLQILNTCEILQSERRVELVPFAWQTLGGAELYDNEARQDAKALADILIRLRTLSERDGDKQRESVRKERGTLL